MTQALVKACTASVRRAAIEPCGGNLRMVKDFGLRCDNKENHLYPIMSGFCNSGWHEGHKVNKPTCKTWVNCPCDCHTTLSRMAALTGGERSLVDNSTWVPERTGMVLPSLTETVMGRIEADPDVVVIQSQAPGIAPNRVEREFAPTSTGRAARGQLEIWVQGVTDIWIMERPENCTPQYVSAAIAQREGLVKGPSTGAIDAVFRRWAEIGFAVIAAKPTRFVMYTPAGVQKGLDVLKQQAKRRG